MAKSIVGLYDQMDEAQQVVQDLVDIGFPRENISLVANDIRNRSVADSGVITGMDEKEDSGHGAASGAGIGAVLGGVAGLLVGLGALAIPGIGPIVAAGPLLAALGGAGIGAAAGGLMGALTNAGVAEPDAKIYAEAVRRGGMLVLAYTADDQAERVLDIFNRHSPVDIRERSTKWEGQSWSDFNENTEVFAFDRDKEDYHARQSQSTLDYGPGARSYLSGQAVDAYDRGSADLGNFQNVQSENWKMLESRFREHFKQNYASQPGAQWEDWRGSYRFGFDMGHLPAYSNQDWDQIAHQIRQRWEAEFSELKWLNYEHAVHDGFEAGHVV